MESKSTITELFNMRDITSEKLYKLIYEFHPDLQGIEICAICTKILRNCSEEKNVICTFKCIPKYREINNHLDLFSEDILTECAFSPPENLKSEIKDGKITVIGQDMIHEMLEGKTVLYASISEAFKHNLFGRVNMSGKIVQFTRMKNEKLKIIATVNPFRVFDCFDERGDDNFFEFPSYEERSTKLRLKIFKSFQEFIKAPDLEMSFPKHL